MAVLAWCAAAAACATPLPDTEAALLAAIAAEVGPAPCTSHAQCHTLPIGARACGGPERWLAWSSAGSDGQRLQDLAGKLSAMAQDRLERSGMASICVVVPDPGAVCRAGACVTGSGRSGAAIR